MKPKMNQKLSLKQHCIETAIKKRYNQRILDYFKSDKASAGQIEAQIELLLEALETLDFGDLRNRYPDLRGNSDATVTLCKDGEGRLHITINGENIES